MAVLFVTEYANGAYSDGQLSNFLQEAPTAEQTVAIGGTTTQSSAFQNNTKFVRISTDAICSVKFGANPTATATTSRMAAGSERIMGVQPGWKVAVITNT